MRPDQLIQQLAQGQYPVMPQDQTQQNPIVNALAIIQALQGGQFPVIPETQTPDTTQSPAKSRVKENLAMNRQRTVPTPTSTISGAAPVSQQQQGNYNVASQLGVKQPQPQNQGFITHVVKPGDTLWGIAHQYTGNGNNWTKLQGFHQDPRTLQAGTVIHIPQNLAQGQSIGKAPSNVYAGGGNIG